jgi:hypothetical protein
VDRFSRHTMWNELPEWIVLSERDAMPKGERNAESALR